MGVESPEARSIPRNRKCGNCRFYEPAPLWRKGWCRNPKLYPPHANHLVDATSIDCEGGFRSRIYWEPLPVAEETLQPQPAPRTIRPQQPPPVSNVQARPVDQPIASPRQTVSPPPVEPRFQPPAPEPTPIPVVEAVVIEHPADPSAVPSPGGPDWRSRVRQRLPFTRQWPLEKVTFSRQTAPYWAIAGVVLIVVLFLIVGSLGKKSADATQLAATQATATAQIQATALSALTVQAQFTTAAVAVATPTPTKATAKTALVKGNGPTPLNVREDASLKAKAVTTIKEGEKVTILDGPKDADGRSWYKVDYNGKVGWAAKDYLEVQP